MRDSLPELIYDGTRAYVHADYEVLDEIPNTGTQMFYLNDALGSVRALVSGTGTITGTASTFGYTGEQKDQTTGYTFLRARYLDPKVGRFTSADEGTPARLSHHCPFSCLDRPNESLHETMTAAGRLSAGCLLLRT